MRCVVDFEFEVPGGFWFEERERDSEDFASELLFHGGDAESACRASADVKVVEDGVVEAEVESAVVDVWELFSL